MNDKKFWLIWNPSQIGHAPTYRHTTYESAKKEAERLARMSRGHDFYILEALDVVAVAEPPIEVRQLTPLSDDEITKIEASRSAMVTHCNTDDIPSEPPQEWWRNRNELSGYDWVLANRIHDLINSRYG